MRERTSRTSPIVRALSIFSERAPKPSAMRCISRSGLAKSIPTKFVVSIAVQLTGLIRLEWCLAPARYRGLCQGRNCELARLSVDCRRCPADAGDQSKRLGEARTVMGEAEAAVAVACLLAGGYLRELTRKAGEGKFSLGQAVVPIFSV
jgi:hypothetical protein